eukprot:TRINITY_DN280_c0_g2_i1.p1 TRINITY_DN280_c0_g2~~TRINITY_DN280_c0_g2_i1.p1  ORF type:complete len:131 (+),score=15.27 TRINITY_DN280_c0_g2_i1:104-496(+)
MMKSNMNVAIAVLETLLLQLISPSSTSLDYESSKELIRKGQLVLGKFPAVTCLSVLAMMPQFRFSPEERARTSELLDILLLVIVRLVDVEPYVFTALSSYAAKLKENFSAELEDHAEALAVRPEVLVVRA